MTVERCPTCGGNSRVVDDRPGYLIFRCDGCQETRVEEVVGE